MTRPRHVPAPGNPAPADDVRTMFDRIAPIYDAMNTLMTAGLDARWRRDAAGATGLAHGGTALDVACGTGALTRLLARMVGPSGTVVGLDAAPAMLRVARRHGRAAGAASIRYVEGDALQLPDLDGAYDAATIAFGLRNVPDYAACISELVRVTRSGGRVVILELATPDRGLGRALAATWFARAVPLIGRLAGGGSAYRYLPDSVRSYPDPSSVAAIMAGAGLVDVTWRRLRPGLVTLHVGRVG